MSRLRQITWSVIAVATVLGLASCGSSSSSGGRVTLNFWAYNEPSGAFRDAASSCSAQSHGEYRITFNPLANDADTQRQSLVRRLAAKDSSIDLLTMDVVWTSEFAEAGWVKPLPASVQARIKKVTLPGPYATATYENKLYAAPANSNTQLLWYRKSLLGNRPVPKTWDQLIATAQALPKGGKVEIQGAAYEGMTVWFNALVASAGGSILSSPTQESPSPAWQQAADIIDRLARSKAADPSLSSQKEDQNRQAFEKPGDAAFQVNYPFIWPSAKQVAGGSIQSDIGWAPYPQVDAGKPVKAPIGGFNFGIGAYTKHERQAVDAVQCLTDERNQREAAAKGGLSPTIASVYDEPQFKKDYPFADLIRRQIEDGGVRPKTPAYADLSLAIDTTLSPPGRVSGSKALSELKGKIKQALKSEGLF